MAQAVPESVMTEGQTVSITSQFGELSVKAGKGFERLYTWKGQTRSVNMLARQGEWLGSKGLYFPGDGEHWKEHEGISRAVLEEGIQRFDEVASLKKWMETERIFLKYHYIKSGIIGGWSLNKDRKQLECEIWLIHINNKNLTLDEWNKMTKQSPK